MAKVVAFNGSPRPEGNTKLLIGQVLQELKKKVSPQNSCRSAVRISAGALHA